MSRFFPPIPNLTADHQIVGPFVAELHEQGRLDSALTPWRWTLPVLLARQENVLTRAQACLLQDIVIETLRLPGRDHAWSILALTEVLPSVRIDDLEETTLQSLYFHTAALHRNVFGKRLISARQLRNDILTRKEQLRSQTAGRGLPYAAFLDRAGDRLEPFI